MDEKLMTRGTETSLIELFALVSPAFAVRAAPKRNTKEKRRHRSFN